MYLVKPLILIHNIIEMKKQIKTTAFTLLSLFLAFAQVSYANKTHAQTAHAQNSYPKPLVTNISCAPYSSNKIIVSWAVPKEIKGSSSGFYISEILVYRDTKPLTSYKDVDDLKPLAKLPASTTSYRDTLTDFRNYYYAVVSIIKEVEEKKAAPFKQENIHGSELYYDEELDGSLDAKKGKIYPMILPGVNASVTGVKVSGSKYSADQKLPLPEKKQYSKGEMREQPLPYMDILDENGTPKKSKGQIGKEANKKAASLIKESKPKASDQPELLPMYVFSEDTVSPAGGDDYLLFDVLKGAFINKRWSQAAKDLEQFLMQNRSASVTNRANFYLGECYYFMAQYPKALNQFLLLRDSYPALTRKWSKSALDLYTLPVEE